MKYHFKMNFVKNKGMDTHLHILLESRKSNLSEFMRRLLTAYTAWESAGNEPGFYTIEATLRDIDSDILERKTELFRLGISTAEVTELIAAPRKIEIGNNIDISLVFTNTGIIPTSATLFINVRDEAGETEVKFEQEVIELDPGLYHEFHEIWNTTGVPEGTYSILGYAAYENKTTEPKITYVTTRPFKGLVFY